MVTAERLVQAESRLAAVLAKRAGVRSTLEQFAERFMRTDTGDPVRPANELHRYLVGVLSGLRDRRGARECVLAPRGSAKSTYITLASPLRDACERTEPYIVLTADTVPQAEKYLDAIRGELQNNEELAAAYPGACGVGPTWTKDRIVMRNGVCIEAVSTGRKLRGRRVGSHRPSLILVDDPQNLEHIVSPLMRARSWEWLTKDVCNAGSPTTNIVVAGTALHRECIVCRLQTTAGWNTRLFKSINQWPERMDLWKEWEGLLNDWEDDNREGTARAFYLENREEMDA